MLDGHGCPGSRCAPPGSTCPAGAWPVPLEHCPAAGQAMPARVSRQPHL